MTFLLWLPRLCVSVKPLLLVAFNKWADSKLMPHFCPFHQRIVVDIVFIARFYAETF